MKISAFTPLLIWILGFLALREWSDCLRVINGRGKVDDPEGDSAQDGLWFVVSLFWFVVSLFWFILGIVLCV